MATRVELVHKALKNLGVLPQGQNPSAEEFNQVDALVEPMIEDLAGRDICTIGSTSIIDDKYFLALANVLAGHAQSEFGMQNDPALTARAMRGEIDLQKIFSTRPTYGTLKVLPY